MSHCILCEQDATLDYIRQFAEDIIYCNRIPQEENYLMMLLYEDSLLT